MSFYAQNNRIYIKDNDGNVVFDTDRKMPAITTTVSGSIDLPERAAGDDGSKTYKIQDVSYSPTFVLAIGVITGDSDYPWKDTDFNASGSVVINLGWHEVNGSWKIGVCRTIVFYVSSNALYLEENWFSHFSTVSTKACTIDFTCHLGSFE